jgi:hypothetical protein
MMAFLFWRCGMAIPANMTADEQKKYVAYRDEAKAIREGGAGGWSEKKDTNRGVPMEPSDLLMTADFLNSYSKKLD